MAARRVLAPKRRDRRALSVSEMPSALLLSDASLFGSITIRADPKRNRPYFINNLSGP